MKEGFVKLVVVIDESGSMDKLRYDTIGGFNTLISDHKDSGNNVNITTVMFNSSYKVVHDAVNIKDITPLTPRDYAPSGMTALNDAVGYAVNKVGMELNDMKEEDRPSSVIVSIITGGQENSSTEYSTDKLKELIEQQTNKYSWEFLYMGANVESFLEASKIGVKLYGNYTASSVGSSSVYQTLSHCVSKGIRGQSANMEDFRGLK